MESTTLHNSPAPPAGTSQKLGVGVVAGVLLAGTMLYAGLHPRFEKQHELTANAQEARDEVPTVTFVVPQLMTASDLSLPGNIQAVEQTTINARTSGYLRQRYVDIGSRVKKGQTLAEIESPEVDQQALQSVADTAKSQAGLSQANADLAQKRAGVSQAKSELLRSQANLRQAQAAVTGAEAKVAQSKAAEAVAAAKLAQAQQDLEGKRANLQQARTQEDFTKKTLDRYESLAKQGFVAQQDVDTQHAAYDTAKAGTVAAQAAIASAEANVQASRDAVTSAKADTAATISQVDAAKQNEGAFKAAIASTQSTIDAANANVQASTANITANNASIRSSRANEKRFEVLRTFEKVTAPFDGVITTRNVDLGALISAGTSTDSNSSATPHTGLFGIARTDTLRIQVAVPQSFVASIHPGQQAEISIAEIPGKPFEGTVFQTAGALDANTRTLLTEVRLPNRGNRLLPGMYATVVFPSQERKSLPRIKSNALLFDSKGTRVVVIDGDDKIHFKTVRLGRDYGKEIEVTDGITGKERLITDVTDDLKEGMKVHPIPAPEDKDK